MGLSLTLLHQHHLNKILIVGGDYEVTAAYFMGRN